MITIVLSRIFLSALLFFSLYCGVKLTFELHWQLGLQVTESKDSLKNALNQAKQLQEHIAAALQWTQNVESAIGEDADVRTLQVILPDRLIYLKILHLSVYFQRKTTCDRTNKFKNKEFDSNPGQHCFGFFGAHQQGY